MIGDSVISMKAASVVFVSLFSAATAYAPCALQAEFDTVMCKSYTCMKCVGMDFCEDKCIGYQKKYPLCRCPEWPCERRCYNDKACPNDDQVVACWTTTTTTTTTTTPAPELVKEILDLAEKVEKKEISKEEFVEKLVESGDANKEMAEEMAEEVDSGKLSKEEISKEMTEPNNQPKSLQDLGNTPGKTLAKCQGDCDADSDCGSGLKCFHRSSSKALVPGCNAGGKGDVPTHDYCYEAELPLVLQNLGDSGCSKSNKCGACQGDCDSDDDCTNNGNTQLFCFQRSKSDELVPGCTAGGKGDIPTHDYCYARTATSLQNKGDNPKEKLAACHGDCDKDSDCESGLKCFHRSSSKALVPGCDPGQSGDEAAHDYCYKPSDAGELELQFLGNSGCKGSTKCGECQGDCDNDNDCSNGLKCFQREKGQNVPGCSGTAHKDNTDYCYRAPEAYPLSTKHDGKCLDYNPGDKNVYMHKCHDGKNQKWYIDSFGNLKTKHDDKCLDYNPGNGNVYMHKCHDDKNQQWYFKNGHLKTRHDDKCLDYNYNNKNVYMGRCHDGKNQQWYFKKAAAASVLQANSSLVARSLQPKSSLAETNVHVAQQQLSAETNDHNAQQVEARVAKKLALTEPMQQSFFGKIWSWFSPAAAHSA